MKSIEVELHHLPLIKEAESRPSSLHKRGMFLLLFLSDRLKMTKSKPWAPSRDVQLGSEWSSKQFSPRQQ